MFKWLFRDALGRLDSLLVAVGYIAEEIRTMSTQLDALTAQVTANGTVIGSAITLIQGLKAQLDAAGTDPAKLQALSDSLAKTDSDLAAAVAANTVAG